MSFFDDLRDGVDRLAVFVELDCEASGLAVGAGALSDASVREAFATVAELSRGVKKLEVVLAGVIAQRSTRRAGHDGLAQTGGFRTPVQMVQEVTGIPRGEAVRVVKVGEALLETAVGVGSGPAAAGVPDGAADAADAPSAPSAPPAVAPWHEPLGEALLSGTVSHAQIDVIRRGLGEPPTIDGRADEDVTEVWRVAATQLIGEAAGCTVEDLAAAARAVRDAIDPAGAEARWAQHYEGRSFRVRVDGEGRRHGHILFDDLTFAFWQGVMDAALRPRRGGPRFMTDTERARAAQLVEDPRTNEQLAYDLVTDLFRAGSVADAKDVFGARQPGVRLVTIRDTDDTEETTETAVATTTGATTVATGTGTGTGTGTAEATGTGTGAGTGTGTGATAGTGTGTGAGIGTTGATTAGTAATAREGAVGRPRDVFGRLLTVVHTEDGQVTLPGSVLGRSLCETGSVAVTVDACGNPLDVGREHRLFTPPQRLALAVRDGGCMAPGCDRPPAYCEAHHIDRWDADQGRTDIDRGILLCTYHHLHLHHTGQKITRAGKGAFLLHPPPGDPGPPVQLRSKSPLRWMFDPPPRTGWRTAA